MARKRAKPATSAERTAAYLQRKEAGTRRNPERSRNTVLSLINPPKREFKFSKGAASKVRYIVRDGKPVAPAAVSDPSRRQPDAR